MERTRRRKRARKGDQWVCSSIMVNLPSHILMEILSRLPIKAVMAMRCVCKSLLNLISDSYFAKLHSARAPIELLLRNRYHEELSTTLYIAEPLFQIDSSSVVDLKLNVVFDLPRFSVRAKNILNFRATKSKLNLVNTCHGLVCYCGPSTNRFAVISNPITGEYVTVPGPDKKDKTIQSWSTSYALGFSPKANRYKLLRLLRRKDVDIDPVTGEELRIISRKVAETYTFGEDGLWKNVSDCPDVYLPTRTTFFRGVLHWYRGDWNYKDTIFTFDFDTEQFGKILTPPHFCNKQIKLTAYTSWGVLRECLYITDDVGDFVDIWVMKEYGVQDSWIKAFSIQKDALCKSTRETYEPINYLQNEEILIFQKGCDLTCYNPVTRVVKSIGTCSPCPEAISFRPSLVSLKDAMSGDNVKVRNLKLRCAQKKLREVAEIPSWWTSSFTKEERRKRHNEHIEELKQLHKRMEGEIELLFEEIKQLEHRFERMKEMKQNFNQMDDKTKQVEQQFQHVDLFEQQLKQVQERVSQFKLKIQEHDVEMKKLEAIRQALLT